jgi:hypothetical protein
MFIFAFHTKIRYSMGVILPTTIVEAGLNALATRASISMPSGYIACSNV